MFQLQSDDFKMSTLICFVIIMTSLSITFFYSLLSCGIINFTVKRLKKCVPEPNYFITFILIINEIFKNKIISHVM